MTLESTINKNRYIGNGATTQFPFTFKVWKTDQVLVYVGDGTTEQEVSAQCTVNITASGGHVTFPTAPESGTIIVLRRNMPYIQEDDYRNGTRFDSEEVEDRFDQDCAERQDLRLDVGRSFKAPITSEKTPEEYEQEFWDAFGDASSKLAEVSAMHAEVMAERDKVIDEGDRQVQRVQNAADSYYAEYGTGCMEINWVLTQDVSAGTAIDISPLWYLVGRHHMQVSVNGVRQYRTRQYREKGGDGTRSSEYVTLVDLNAGDTVNVWVSHLAGAVTASAEHDGLMSAEHVQRLYAEPIETSFGRTTTVLDATVEAGTEIDVPLHIESEGLLMVYHNGVLCEEGESAQYMDTSSTTIAFNYDLLAGDTITAVAVDVVQTGGE